MAKCKMSVEWTGEANNAFFLLARRQSLPVILDHALSSRCKRVRLFAATIETTAKDSDGLRRWALRSARYSREGLYGGQERDEEQRCGPHGDDGDAVLIACVSCTAEAMRQ
eukprot:6196627-Pleurochrysis_carterae.AAC.1